VQRDRLILGLAGVFAGMTAIVLLVALATGQPVLFVVAVPLGVATGVFWYHASGALAARIQRMQRQPDPRRARGSDRGGFGAGPREGFEGARGRAAREQWERRQRAGGRRQRAAGGRRRRRAGTPGPSAGMSRAEAYDRLGLEEGADQETVRRAYREKVKEVHPDRGGDEAEFRKVTEAYETLAD
jgi:hypothetical protein